MEFFGLLLQIFAFAIMTDFKKLANVANEIMLTLEDYEVYDKIFRVRSFKPYPWPDPKLRSGRLTKRNPKFLSFCVGNVYFWQVLATIGFCHFLQQLADKFSPPHIIAIEVSPSMELLLEERDISLEDAASKTDTLDRENAGLRVKVERLEKEVEFITKDRYAFVRENCVLQNRLMDFNSWPDFRVEYDELVAEFQAMKRQRTREHILQEQFSHIAKGAKLELAAAKRAGVMSKVAHSEELKQAQQERDEASEKYQTLLANSATSTTTTATNAAVATIAVAPEGSNPGDRALQEENIRLTLDLRSQTSLLSKKSSDLDRMQSLLKTRSSHSATQLKAAASTILSLEEEKNQAEERSEELERDLLDANEKAEEMEGLYMALAFGDEEEGSKEKEEQEEEGRGEEGADTSWLLKHVVAMSKKQRASGAGSGVDENGSDADNEDDSKDQDDDEEDEEDEEWGEQKKSTMKTRIYSKTWWIAQPRRGGGEWASRNEKLKLFIVTYEERENRGGLWSIIFFLTPVIIKFFHKSGSLSFFFFSFFFPRMHALEKEKEVKSDDGVRDCNIIMRGMGWDGRGLAS